MQILIEHKLKLILLLLLVLITGLFIYFDLHSYFQLDYLKTQQQSINDMYIEHPILFPVLFFLLYLFVAGLSIPGATIFTLAAGAFFGLVYGTIIASFASVMGATMAFLISRYLLKGIIHDRYVEKLTVFDEGIERDGGYYLFTLRLVPVFPFFIINLVMGITTIRLSTFYWVSQLGMLPATIVYVNAGKQLSELETLAGILSPDLIFAFVLLGVFPLLAKLTVNWLAKRRVIAGTTDG